MSATKTMVAVVNGRNVFGDKSIGWNRDESEIRVTRLQTQQQLGVPKRWKTGDAVTAGDCQASADPVLLTCSTPAPRTPGCRRPAAFPVSPIADRTQSIVVPDTLRCKKLDAAASKENDLFHFRDADDGAGGTLFHRSMKSYARTPVKRKTDVVSGTSRFEKLNMTASKENDLFQSRGADDGACGTLFHPTMKSYSRTPAKCAKTDVVRVLHDLDVSSSSSASAADGTPAATESVNPCDFMALEEADRDDTMSVLDYGCPSRPSPVTVRRKRRIRNKPIWDEASYRHVFAEINREFEEIDRIELFVENEDPCQTQHS